MTMVRRRVLKLWGVGFCKSTYVKLNDPRVISGTFCPVREKCRRGAVSPGRALLGT